MPDFSTVKTARITATGSAVAGEVNLKSLTITPTNSLTQTRLTLTDGDGGDVVLDIDDASLATIVVTIPEDGLWFQGGIWVSTATNLTAATLFYTGG